MSIMPALQRILKGIICKGENEKQSQTDRLEKNKTQRELMKLQKLRK
jgi:hypothetical protein